MSVIQFIQVASLLAPLFILHQVESHLDTQITEELKPSLQIVANNTQPKIKDQLIEDSVVDNSIRDFIPKQVLKHTYNPEIEIVQEIPIFKVPEVSDTQDEDETRPDEFNKKHKAFALVNKINQVLGYRKHSHIESPVVTFMKYERAKKPTKREIKLQVKQESIKLKHQINSLKQSQKVLYRQKNELSQQLQTDFVEKQE